jgi:hypothetical protein
MAAAFRLRAIGGLVERMSLPATNERAALADEGRWRIRAA